MTKKSNWAKFIDKVTKIDFEDFTDEEIKSFDNALIVCAKDKFLSGWGVAEGRSCYQVVVCFNQKIFYNICDSLHNDDTFTLVCKYRHVEDFLKSSHKGILSVKNARHCPAWNKGAQ